MASEACSSSSADKDWQIDPHVFRAYQFVTAIQNLILKLNALEITSFVQKIIYYYLEL